MEKSLQDYCIVIVDDESMVTSSLSALLQLEDFKIPIVYNSPIEALDFIRKNKVDLVISDFLMPEMNGLQFLREVKSCNPGTTLILLTGYADKESAIKAINDIGLYRYIEKPWDSDDLVLCIKNGLERSYLVENLENKINELSEAKGKLEIYNDQLEALVRERTSDLILANGELEKSNIKLGAIINHCADGIITITNDCIISQANPALERLIGINKSDLEKKCFSEFFILNSSDSLIDSLNPKKEILLRDYKVFNRINNREIPVEISFAPILSSQNEEVSHYVGVIRDVTVQQETDRLREDFIATLTHDLRTPLLAAIQTLKFFLDGSLGELGDRQQLLLNTMLQSNQDMLGLVNALLEVYRYESGQLVLCKDYFNVSDLINQCIHEVESLLEKKQIELRIKHIDDVKIYTDKQELRRVFANLLGNAINHTASNGSITVSIESTKNSIVFSIKDTGIGIPGEDVSKLFGRFSQGTSKKRSTGTGLGLYLSRQIVEAHDGKIWLESEFGKGSKFYFSIPMCNKG